MLQIRHSEPQVSYPFSNFQWHIEADRSDPFTEGTLQELVARAGRDGKISVLRWLVHDAALGYEDVFDVEPVLASAIYAAASRGHMDILSWLEGHIDDVDRFHGAISLAMQGHVKTGFIWGLSVLFETALGGHIDCLLWLRKYVRDIDFGSQIERARIVHELAKRGDNHLLDWLKENTDVSFKDCIDSAAACGQFETVLWLHRSTHAGCTTWAMDKAAAIGRLDIVRWLHANRTEGCTKAAMDGAACNGKLSVVKWLHENRPEGCGTEAMDGAAEYGELDVIEWLHTHRKEGCTTHAMDFAAAFKHKHVLIWLHENRGEGCSENVMQQIYDYAEQSNTPPDADVLAFLLEHYPERCQRQYEELSEEDDWI